jgi:hypothetical protein
MREGFSEDDDGRATRPSAINIGSLSDFTSLFFGVILALLSKIVSRFPQGGHENIKALA